jgi:hypothetical protein
VKFQTIFSDIDEGQDLWMDKNIKAARFEPPKKTFSILDGLDQEQEDKCILHEDLKIHNLAMPNMNLKTGKRLPGAALMFLFPHLNLFSFFFGTFNLLYYKIYSLI